MPFKLALFKGDLIRLSDVSPWSVAAPYGMYISRNFWLNWDAGIAPSGSLMHFSNKEIQTLTRKRENTPGADYGK